MVKANIFTEGKVIIIEAEIKDSIEANNLLTWLYHGTDPGLGITPLKIYAKDGSKKAALSLLIPFLQAFQNGEITISDLEVQEFKEK